MLRGPQTLREIKGRTGQLFEFPSMKDVELAMSDSSRVSSPRSSLGALPILA
jgi:uncharacterized protein YceH (UPF0502 family)